MSEEKQPLVVCNCCHNRWATCVDPDLGMVCSECWKYLEEVSKRLRDTHEKGPAGILDSLTPEERAEFLKKYLE